jgi:ribose 1,5-bisphosphokinase
MSQMTFQRSAGRLVLVVGPSGAGKDTLIDAARRAFAQERWIAFPRRIVTRPADAGGEDHEASTSEAFAAARERGAYCLAWSAHGLGYGVPVEVLRLVEAGLVAVVNVSRAMIRAAERLGVSVTVLHVTAPTEVLAARLAGRGRESTADVAARLAREAPIDCAPGILVEVVNGGSLEDGARAMIAALLALRPAADGATGSGSARRGATA